MHSFWAATADQITWQQAQMMKVRGPKSGWMSCFLQYLQQFWTAAHEASTRLLRGLILPAGCRSAIPDHL